MGKANRYFIQMEFEGGCRSCPFCPRTECLILQKRIEFRFKVDVESGEVIVFFDPFQQRDKDCPLTQIKNANGSQESSSPKRKKPRKKSK